MGCEAVPCLEVGVEQAPVPRVCHPPPVVRLACFGVWGLGFWVLGFGFGVWGLGCGVCGLGFGFWVLGFAG